MYESSINGHGLKIIFLIFLILYLILITSLSQGALTADQILDKMENNTAKIKDLTATISIATYQNKKVKQTQQMKMVLLQPDRMKQEFLSPDYLKGNKTIIIGKNMWMYIAAADTCYRKDLSTLSAAQQPWLMFRNILRDVRNNLDYYKFTRHDHPESNVYYIQGTPTSEEAVYGKIDLWVDADTFTPQRRVLYDVEGNLLVDIRFSNTGKIEDIAIIPLRIEAYNNDGVLQNVITYQKIDLNTGITKDAFQLPKGCNE